MENIGCVNFNYFKVAEAWIVVNKQQWHIL